MADPVDVANDYEEQVKALQVKAIRAAAGRRELHPVGACHFCSEPVGGAMLFCDRDCAEDHERMKGRGANV